MFLQLLKIILCKFVAKARLDEEYADQFIDKYTQVGNKKNIFLLHSTKSV